MRHRRRVEVRTLARPRAATPSVVGPWFHLRSCCVNQIQDRARDSFISSRNGVIGQRSSPNAVQRSPASRRRAAVQVLAHLQMLLPRQALLQLLI